MAGPVVIAARRVLRSRAFRLLMLQVGPAVTAQAVNLARHGQWRQLAILHADSLTEGRFSREVLDDGAVHWVVWQADRPVAAYPAFDGPLEQTLDGHDPAIRRAPAELPTRRVRHAGASRARRAGEGIGRVVRRGGAGGPRPAGGGGPPEDEQAAGQGPAGEGAGAPT